MLKIFNKIQKNLICLFKNKKIKLLIRCPQVYSSLNYMYRTVEKTRHYKIIILYPGFRNIYYRISIKLNITTKI